MSLALATTVLLGLATAAAQPADPTPPPAAAPPPPPVVEEASAEAKKKAGELRKGAKKLFDKGEHYAALVVFQSAFRTFPSSGAILGTASCLLKLKRFDEALEAFEVAARDYGSSMSGEAKNEVLKQIDLMRTITGSVVVTGAEVGALLVVNGRVRGEHPTATPLAVLVGPHLVRVYKEGFAVLEKSIDVGKGQVETVPARLTPLAASRSGRLKVAETGGKKMEVVIDGVPVGVTPWEGPVAAGEHAVLLRPVPPAALPSVIEDGCACHAPLSRTERAHLMGTEDTVAAVPVTILVKPYQTATLRLKAEPLGAAIKIASAPAVAAVFVDGVALGRGGFEGRLTPGVHEIRTEAPGYFPETRRVTIPDGEERVVPITLRKDHNAPIWAAPGHHLVEASGGGVLVPSFGGDVAATCNGGCQQGVGAGGRVALRAGYEYGNGFGFGATLGYLGMQQSTTDRTAILLPDDPKGSTSAGVLNDTIAMQSFLAGPYAALRLGERFPVHLGLAAGISLSTVSDRRTGLFDSYAVGPVTQSGFFAWVFVEPELRVGVHVSEHLTVGVTVSGLLLVATRVPQWNEDMKINPHGGELQLDPDERNNIGEFSAETITGSVIFGITEGLSARYDF